MKSVESTKLDIYVFITKVDSNYKHDVLYDYRCIHLMRCAVKMLFSITVAML